MLMCGFAALGDYENFNADIFLRRLKYKHVPQLQRRLDNNHSIPWKYGFMCNCKSHSPIGGTNEIGHVHYEPAQCHKPKMPKVLHVHSNLSGESDKAGKREYSDNARTVYFMR